MSNLILSQGNKVEFATWDGVKSRSFIEKERYYGYDKECEIWCNYEAHRAKIKEILLDLCNNDESEAKAKLEGMTSFTTKEGKEIKGRKSTTELSPKQVQMIYGRLKKEADDQERQMAKGAGSE